VFLLAAMISVFLSYTVPVKGVFKELLIGLVAVKVIAERTELTALSFGTGLMCFWAGFNVILASQALGLIFPGHELAGTFIMPWMMGSAAVLSIPFIKEHGKKWLVLILPAILLSKSTACAAVAILMFVLPLKITQKKTYVTIGALSLASLVAYVLIFDFSFETTRFGIWKNTFAHIHNFWTGSGIGSWMHKAFFRMNGETPVHWVTAHNLYYQTLFEMGIIGLLALLAVLRELWVKSYGPARNALLGLLMLSFVHPIVHYPRFSLFLVVLAGMILRNDGIQHEEI
jgi:O-antigen ligase